MKNERELNPTDINTDEGQSDQKEKATAPVETGKVNLMIGGGFAAYGATIATTMGYICPFCLVATPLFLGLGGVQRYKYLKSKAEEKDGG